MKYLRRMMSFLAVRMIIFTICAAILVCAFYIAFNLGNAYVLITEGMEKRAVVALTRENATDLNGYFTTERLEADATLAYAFSPESPYLAYNITSYDYSIKIESLMVWPWSNEIKCTVVEHMKDIRGTVKAAYASTVKGNPEVWKSGRYELILKKQAGGQWKISYIGQDLNYRDTSEAQ